MHYHKQLELAMRVNRQETLARRTKIIIDFRTRLVEVSRAGEREENKWIVSECKDLTCGMPMPRTSSSLVSPTPTDDGFYSIAMYVPYKRFGILPPSLSASNCRAVSDKARRAKDQVIYNRMISVVEGLRPNSISHYWWISEILGFNRPTGRDEERPWPTKGKSGTGADGHDRLGCECQS
jgi:hypothetical protein